MEKEQQILAKIQGCYDEFQRLENQAKTIADSKKSVLEETEQWLDELGRDCVPVKNDLGETRYAVKEVKPIEKTNKKSIAEEMGVKNKELQMKPYHISKYTREGKLSPELIAKHTTPDVKVDVKFQKRPLSKDKHSEE